MEMTTPAVALTTPAVAMTTPAAAPTTTTPEFREPLATDYGMTTVRSGVAERQGFPGDDNQEGEESSRVGVIAGSLAGLLALILLILLVLLVRYGCCYCCCCFAAAAGDEKKEPVSDQAYDNEIYQDLASCISMGEKPPMYDNVAANTDEKMADVDNLYSGDVTYDNSVADKAVNVKHVYEDVK